MSNSRSAAVRGAVAANHRETARVGATVLEQGGNAVDAAIAMIFASTVVESTLTSLAGGGFMLVDAPGCDPEVLDFFVGAPGEALAWPVTPWRVYELRLRNTVMNYGAGPASVAVPGVPAGIGAAWERYGTLPLPKLAAPAAELATSGVQLTAAMAHEHRLYSTLLSSTDAGRNIYVSRSTMQSYVEGELFRQPQMAATIEEIAATAGRTFYDGRIANEILEWSRREGGRITEADLRNYEVRSREPIRTENGSAVLLTTPSPSEGGRLTTTLFERIQSETRQSLTAARIGTLVAETMASTPRPSTAAPAHGEPVTIGDPSQLPLDTVAQSAVLEVAEGAPTRSPNTTHVSAVDRDGMIATATTSLGFGSGEFVGDTGVQMNNIIAEYDYSMPRPAGIRLPSMMTPSMMRDGELLVAIGSAGSDRIPQALAQVLTHTRQGKALQDAVSSPRFVFDGEVLHVEPGMEQAAIEQLGADREIRMWTQRDPYFGTVNAVSVGTRGYEAAGDVRREGDCIIL